MDQRSLTIAMGAATGLAAIALLAQMALLMALSRLRTRVVKNVQDTARYFPPLLAESQSAFQEIRADVFRIKGTAHAHAVLLRKDLALLHELREDASEFLERRRERADLMVNDAVNRVVQTRRFAGPGFASPIREIARGVQFAIHGFRSAA